jgi:hypothetical protein
MFLGSYWSQREEPREAVAVRVARFLQSISAQDTALSIWFMKANTESAARVPLGLVPTDIALKLKNNRGDIRDEIIPALGFSLGIWNGGHASFRVRAGVYSPRVGNAAVLSLSGPPPLDASVWKAVLVAAISSFDPDRAVVTSHERLKMAGATHPWDVGLFTYERGRDVTEHR